MKKIYVGNLAHETTDDELREAFASFGEIRSATVIRDRATGMSRGFGFIEMENDQEAAAAIAGMNEKDLGGRNLNVSEARPRADTPRGAGGGGGGRGGRDGGRSQGDRGRRW